MSDDKKASTDTETILMALDQVSQTIDVMTSVVGRLKTYLNERERAPESETGSRSEAPSRAAAENRTLH